MNIKSVSTGMPAGAQKPAALPKKKSGSIIKDGFQKAKDMGKLAGDKMKSAVRFIRTKSPTNRALSTVFGLATVGVGIAGLTTAGTLGMPVLAHLGVTLAATFTCSYLSHRFA